jgi:pyruvate,water dikinase
VVVGRQPSARLVLVMDRIAAIITEVGSPTGHMSILAREFRIPTLVEVGGATKILTPGQIVTVDADAALIYPGIMPELLARNVKQDEAWRNDPVFLLRRILKSSPPQPYLERVSGRHLALHDITRLPRRPWTPCLSRTWKRPCSHHVTRLKPPALNLFILDLGRPHVSAGESPRTIPAAPRPCPGFTTRVMGCQVAGPQGFISVS